MAGGDPARRRLSAPEMAEARAGGRTRGAVPASGGAPSPGKGAGTGVRGASPPGRPVSGAPHPRPDRSDAALRELPPAAFPRLRCAGRCTSPPSGGGAGGEGHMREKRRGAAPAAGLKRRRASRAPARRLPPPALRQALRFAPVAAAGRVGRGGFGRRSLPGVDGVLAPGSRGRRGKAVQELDHHLAGVGGVDDVVELEALRA